jgi:putative endonuclease
LKVHREGKGAKYTKARLPVSLVYYEEFSSKKEAMSREWHIHHDSVYTKKKKEQMINHFKKKHKI